MTSARTFENLQVDITEDGIATVAIDMPGTTENRMHLPVRDDLFHALEAMVWRFPPWPLQESRLPAGKHVRAIVLTSGKETGLFVGAHLKHLPARRHNRDAGHPAVFQQLLSNFLDLVNQHVPIVAALHGTCLASGTKVPISCAYRIASDDSTTELGFTEVASGLLPAAATWRVPKLIGIPLAIHLLTTGEALGSWRALEVGLIDEVVPKQALLETAYARARQFAAIREGALIPERVIWPSRHPPARGRLGDPFENVRDGTSRGLPIPRSFHGLAEPVMDQNRAWLESLFARAREELVARTVGRFPGPLMILDAIEAGVFRGKLAADHAESEAWGTLFNESYSRVCDYWFARNRLRARVSATPRMVVDQAALVTSSDEDVSGFVAECRDYGVPLVVVAGSQAASSKALEDVSFVVVEGSQSLPAEALAFAKTAAARKDVIGAQIVSPMLLAGEGIADLPLTKLCLPTFIRARVPAMWGVIELVGSRQCPQPVRYAMGALARRLTRVVIDVTDTPGFYCARTFAAMLSEGLRLLEDGVPLLEIDRALQDWGFAVSPFVLADSYGIESCERLLEKMRTTFGDRFAAPTLLGRMRSRGWGGAAKEPGFYQTSPDVLLETRPSPNPDLSELIPVAARSNHSEVLERIVLATIIETVECLQSEVITDADSGDVAAILACGFPRVHGPFRYVEHEGAGTIIRRMHAAADRFGDRYRPPRLLESVEQAGNGFAAWRSAE